MRPPKPRRRAAVMLAAVVLASAGGIASAALAAPRAESRKAKISDYFSDEDLSRSRRYRSLRYALGFASLGLGLTVGCLLGLGAPTRRIGAWAERATGGRWALTALLLVVVVTVAGRVVTLPLSVARDLYHERAWGLSTQSLGAFFADVGKGTGFELVVSGAVALGFFGIVRWLPRGWPLAASAFMVALTVALFIVYPLVYEPLFNRFTPVDPATRERIVAIGERAGVKVGQVLVADASRRTTKQNAYVSGLGATKRVVLYDTLLEKSTPKEVDLVVAHELGHVVHRDVLKGTVAASIGAVAGVLLVWRLLAGASVLRFVGSSAPRDPRSLPFLALVLAVATFLVLPAQNWYSRRIEASADRFAIAVTGDPDTHIAVEVNLARDNIADLQPGSFMRWAFFTHPTTLERIQIGLDAKAAP
jgi:STE24 endopeptidase